MELSRRIDDPDVRIFAEVTDGDRILLDPERLLALCRASLFGSEDMESFRGAYADLLAGRPSALDFEETFYLSMHADVRASLEKGHFHSGFEHFCLHGRQEGRVWSNQGLRERFGLSSGVPFDIAKPEYMQVLPSFPRLPPMPSGPGRMLLLMADELKEDYFYAGYASYFTFFREVEGLFDRVVVSVENPDHQAGLLTGILPGATVIPSGRLGDIGQQPDLVAAYSHFTLARACDLFGDPDRALYFCQEYEPGFFPLGARHAFAERSIRRARHLVVSTGMLCRFLESRGLLSNANVFVSTPAIRPFPVSPTRNRRIFYYFRPEAFNQRNLPEHVWASALRFCETHSGYELYLVGTVRTRFSFSRNGNQVFVLSKLPTDQYLSIISSCDVVVSLIYAPHPGVVAYQAAASGIPTVTNTYENRRAEDLRAISDNILPFDPVMEDLTDKVGEALSMPRGRPSYRPDGYGHPTTGEAARNFIAGILRLGD